MDTTPPPLQSDADASSHSTPVISLTTNSHSTSTSISESTSESENDPESGISSASDSSLELCLELPALAARSTVLPLTALPTTTFDVLSLSGSDCESIPDTHLLNTELISSRASIAESITGMASISVHSHSEFGMASSSRSEIIVGIASTSRSNAMSDTDLNSRSVATSDTASTSRRGAISGTAPSSRSEAISNTALTSSSEAISDTALASRSEATSSGGSKCDKEVVRTSLSYLQELFPNSAIVENSKEYKRRFQDALVVGDIHTIRSLIEDDKVSCMENTRYVMQACEKGHINVVKYLLSQGARTNEQYHYFEKYTPLHSATYRNNAPLIKVLLEHGAYVDATDECGNSCLIVACAFGYTDCVRVLLKVGSANVHMSDQWCHSTALHLSAYQDQVACCQLLVEHGARVNERNENRETALMLACESGAVEVVQYLVQRAGVDVHARSADGDTAMHRIFNNLPRRHFPDVPQMEAMFECLVAGGAHADVPNEWRNTPIDFLLDNAKLNYPDRARLAHKVLPLGLQCLSAQTIAMYQVPAGELPPPMQAFIRLHNDPTPLLQHRYSTHTRAGGTRTKDFIDFFIASHRLNNIDVHNY